MGSTNPGDYSTDVALTNVAIERRAPQFIARELFPVIPVPKLNGNKVWRRDPKSDKFRDQDSTRAAGAEPHANYSGTPDQPVTFDCVDHSLQDLIPDEMEANADVAVRPEIDKTNELMDKLFLSHERTVKSIIDTALTSRVTTVSTAWNNASGTPVTDISAQFYRIEDGIGASPNVLVVDFRVLRAIMHNAETKDIAKQVLRPEEYLNGLGAMAANLASILGLDRVLVANGVYYNTAKKGQDASLSRVWGTDCYLAYVEAPSLSYAGLGLTAQPATGTGSIVSGMSIERDYVAIRKSTRIHSHWYWDALVLNAGAGWKFETTLE